MSQTERVLPDVVTTTPSPARRYDCDRAGPGGNPAASASARGAVSGLR